MKILEALQKFSYTADNKSTTEIIFNMSKHLSIRGHEVTIFTTNYKIDQHKISGLEQFNVKFSISKIWCNIGGFIITPGLLNNISIIKQYDIIHLHNYRTFQNIILAFFANLYDIPYIIQAEGSLTTFYQRKFSKILFDNLFGTTMIRNATKVIAASEQESKQYLKLGVPPDKIVIVPFTIDINEYIHLPEKGLFKKKHRIADNKKIILYLGRLDKMKGLDLLVFAFSDIQKKEDDILLVITGPDDGYLTELCDLIEKLHLKEKIIITGPLYNSDKIEAYHDADIFVLPSYHDDFGLTALESLACGTPVIITNRCGASDVISKNAGLVIDCDKTSLVNAITTLHSDEKLRIKYSEQGKKLIHSDYSWNSIVDLLENCYESCSSRKSKVTEENVSKKI
jgi:glycosyltransferase involved in cell wall biosynthesis